MRSSSSKHYVGLLLLVVVLLTTACFGGPHEIVFVSEVDGNPEVALMDPESGETTRLTNKAGRDFSPSWAPDRKRLAYLTEQSGHVEINLVDKSGQSTNRLTYYENEVQSVLWSPDGQRLALVSSHEGNPEIYVMNANGGDPTRLTFNSVTDHLGGWSPDGEWLVFHSEGPGTNSGLWLRNPAGVNLIHLTRGNDSEPAWSPDNQRIAFVRTQEDDQDIYVAEKASDGTWRDEIEEVRLTQGSAKEGSPVWSPDGKQIAFVSKLYGAGEIFIMDADGGRQRRLTNNNAEDSDPDW